MYSGCTLDVCTVVVHWMYICTVVVHWMCVCTMVYRRIFNWYGELLLLLFVIYCCHCCCPRRKCSGEPHEPCTCEQWEEWKTEVDQMKEHLGTLSSQRTTWNIMVYCHLCHHCHLYHDHHHFNTSTMTIVTFCLS